MNSAPDDPLQHPDDYETSEAGLDASDLRGADDVDPDDEDADGEATGVGEADLDPDDEDS